MNARHQRIGYSGFTPSYTHSDGVKHSGDDPDESMVYLHRGKVRVDIGIIGSPRPHVAGVNYYDDYTHPEDHPDILFAGRELPPLNQESESRPLDKLSNGHLRGRLTMADGQPLMIDVAPEWGYMIVRRSTGPEAHPSKVSHISEVNRVGGKDFPAVVMTEQYEGRSGAINLVKELRFSTPEIGVDEPLWISRIPTEHFLLGKTRRYYADEKGNVHEVEIIKPEKWDRNPWQTVQFLAAFGLVLSSLVLLVYRRQQAKTG